MTKAKKNLLLVALSTFLALLLALASFGTFNARADTITKTPYPDTSQSENLNAGDGYVGPFAQGDGYYYEFSIGETASGAVYLVSGLFTGNDGAINIAYDFETSQTPEVGAHIFCGVAPFLDDSSIKLDYWANEENTKVIIFIPYDLYINGDGTLASDPDNAEWSANASIFNKEKVGSEVELIGIYSSIEVSEGEDNNDNGADGEQDKDIFDTIKDKANGVGEWISENTGLTVSGSFVAVAIILIAVILIKKRR